MSAGNGEETTSESFSDEEPVVYGPGYKLHEAKGPTKERTKPDVVPPSPNVLSEEEFWDESGNPNLNVIRDHLKREGRVGKKQLLRLIDLVYDVFCAEDNLLYVSSPVTVCGDVHGQFYDLLKLFEVGGDPKTTNYLFLGDYVDRGYFSIECVILLFCHKVLFPKTFFMLRGNHECRHLTDYFTFKEECEHKYDIEVYNSVMDAFDALPIAAIMNKQFLCVHGGISPQIDTIDDIKKIDRFVEPPSSGPLCDLLWSDPMEDFSPDTQTLFEFNSVRGCSYNYSFNAVCQFLERNKLLSVIRAHEAQDSGYRMYRKNDRTGFPSVITLFSAPNYLDHYGNKGAVLRYENNVINIRQFNNSPHPYWLPGFMNVFKWSLPFVAEKAGELVLNVFNLVNHEQEMQKEEQEKKEMEEQNKRRDQLRNKVMTVSRILALYRQVRQERERVLEMGPISPKGDTIPENITQVVKKNPLSQSLRAGFQSVKTIDLPNEARPDGLEKTEQEVKAYHDTIQYQRRKSSRELTMSKKSQEELRNLRLKKEKEKKEVEGEGVVVPKMVEPVVSETPSS